MKFWKTIIIRGLQYRILRIDLKNKGLESISSYSIRKILKEFLNYRYKTLHEVHPKTFDSENIRQFFESAYLQVLLERDGVEWIYVDEFSFSTRKQNYKGWVKRGKHGFLKKDVEDWSISCVVAFSWNAIYGVAGSKGTLDSTHFIRFLQNLSYTLWSKF